MQHNAFDTERFLAEAPHLRGSFLYFPELGSTNQEGKLRLQATGGRELALLADKQTAGRGRLNRSWEAPAASGILCTLTFRLGNLPLDKAYLFTAALALSIQKTAQILAGISLDLKWPNDVLRNAKKCCGILAEVESMPEAIWLVLGFGLNTHLTEQDFEAAGISEKATNVTPPEHPVSRELFLAEILRNFEDYRTQLQVDPEAVRQEWAAALLTIGQPVHVLDVYGNLNLSGQAIGVDDKGGLMVQTDAGKIHTVQAGDVAIRLANGRYA